jgi:hypothetical protein
MTKREVKRLLGRPSAKTTARAFFRAKRRAGTHVIHLDGASRNEYWLYLDVPTGHQTRITFTSGRVTEVQTPPTIQ